MIKEEVEEYFQTVRNNIAADHYEGKINDVDLIEKLQLLKDSENEALTIIAMVKKLSLQRE